jgi:hypothetical protein
MVPKIHQILPVHGPAVRREIGVPPCGQRRFAGSLE